MAKADRGDLNVTTHETSSDTFEFLTIEYARPSKTRLDKFLAENEKVGSRTRAAELIEQGLVLINSKKTKASQSLHHGDLIEVRIPQKAELSLKPLDLKLNIVFEDDELIVINKPAGLVVHPAAGHAHDTLVNALVAHTTQLSVGFHELRPGIVHRLDRDTSGLIVVAKTDEAHRELAKQFKAKTSHRVYWAIVYGVPKAKKGTLESLLARHPKDRKKFASHKTTGKKAVTHYEVLEISDLGFSLVHLVLETGRTHQIRVHLSELGHPIIGDVLYGSDAYLKKIKSEKSRAIISEMTRFALHAAELGFVHPKTKETLIFKATWPHELLSIYKSLGFKQGNS